MYTSVKDMLRHAHESHCAAIVINVVNMEQAKTHIENAGEEASAVILNISPRQMKVHAYPYIMAPMTKNLAETVRAPVTLNINRGVNMEDIEMATHRGYSSATVDASSYELEESIRRVRTVAALAHDRDISAGTELGYVSVAANTDDQNEDCYTNVAQAEEFVRRIGCDCLVVVIGTAHGSYPKSMIPKLDFERLRELKEKLSMPLVLHGGSGAGGENIKRAMLYGIDKINVCTDFMDDTETSMLKILEEQPGIQYIEMNEVLGGSMRRFIKHFMRMIGSSGWYASGRDSESELDQAGLTARLGQVRFGVTGFSAGIKIDIPPQIR